MRKLARGDAGKEALVQSGNVRASDGRAHRNNDAGASGGGNGYARNAPFCAFRCMVQCSPVGNRDAVQPFSKRNPVRIVNISVGGNGQFWRRRSGVTETEYPDNAQR